MATHHVNPAAAAVGVAAEERILSWGILEVFAYLEEVENATTAVSDTPDNKHIQITFCLGAPPLLSRFCIHSPDGARMDHAPLIVAMEDDLALLRVDSGRGSYRDYYMYQADDGKEYLVAGYRFKSIDHYPQVCVYNSKRTTWKIHDLSLSVQRHEHRDQILDHKNCKVVTIGGDAGTLAFVDLWQGVLLCDVLTWEREAAGQGKREAIPLLDYVPLPDYLIRTARFKGDARLYRDIAFLNNHLKCVDLGSLSLWIRPATTSGAWSRQYMIRNFKEIVSNNSRINLLPGHISFNGLRVCRPVVDLQHDDDARILYFTVKKVHRTDLIESMLAVDLLTKKILAVAPFVIRYTMMYDFAYMHTRLFKHLFRCKDFAEPVVDGVSLIRKQDEA
ncbi:unnamed protein product [Urochloa decumbens]|uniref:DUF1618 domain-containing protein n=1 Tax=Urochloa decumbens TaxID=240449 RepID=A0ABC9E425_9POAL